jgi:tetratricopeptide (TPR) repeat protein
VKAALALVLALTASAAAETNVEKARGHFKQGKAFQDAGVYERAADEYKLAYAADPRPEMLFNIAQAYRLAKLAAQALDYFKQYLDKQPNGAGADEARKHVVTLTKQIDEENAAKQAPPPTVLPETSPPVIEKPAEAPSSSPGRGLRIAGIVTASSGLVLLGVGVKLAFDARGAASDIDEHTGPWTEDDKDTFEGGERANRNMKIAYAIGGALVIGGGVMYFFGRRAAATPVVTDQSASLVVTGAF